MFRALLTICAVLLAQHAGAQIPAGDMPRGERLFKELQCASCHGANKAGGTAAPNLLKRNDPAYTPNAMASEMWSHATGMWQAMEKAGVQRPQMTPAQAADLFAFLAGASRVDKAGDPAQGRKIYQAKYCASCHDEPYLGAPNLAAQAGTFSSFSMMSSLWQHGAGMLSRMVSKNTAWQTLTPEEMSNLIAYLNSRKQ
jgi:mono/diheme cytochrome c family protein